MRCEMCERAMQAEGRELDRLVAERVFNDPDVSKIGFSRNWLAAGLILEEMRRQPFSVRRRFKLEIGYQVYKTSSADSIHPEEWLLIVTPEMIARAAVLTYCEERDHDS